jgi:hypothetical protein
LLEAIESDQVVEVKAVVLSDAQKQQVREAIENATTRDQVDLIEKQLKVIYNYHSQFYWAIVVMCVDRRGRFHSKTLWRG